jgi:hypothetical protein
VLSILLRINDTRRGISVGSALACLINLCPSGHALPRIQWGDNALLNAMDENGDDILSAAEIQKASVSLRFLDDDGDGALSGLELNGGQASEWDDWDDDWDGDDWGAGGGAGGFEVTGRNQRLLNPEEVSIKDGASSIPDKQTYDQLSAAGEDILGEAGLQYVKFEIEEHESEEPKLYFINTKKHPAHSMFMGSIGKSRGPWGMRGAINYRPLLLAPNGTPGVFTFSFEMQDAFSFANIERARDLLEARSPLLRGKLAYHPMERHLERYQEELAAYEAAKFPVLLAEQLFTEIGFLPLHMAESYGRLRLMNATELPGPRDVVIIKNLPNEMPRVAGILTSVRQTPLSHVNLRAIQDDVPNAYFAGVDVNESIQALIGKYVYYRVASDGITLREASSEDVNAHFETLRPAAETKPPRDLSVKAIRPLEQIGFEDSTSFGVKAANVATLGSLGLGEGVTPKGFAVPFHFYDAFMHHNQMYEAVVAMRNSDGFQADTEQRIKALSAFRKRIKAGVFPAGLHDALEKHRASFPEGTSLRCRSSTNNEDLPGFSGAGLYDSYTHHPDEGALAKSIRQVFASMWNFRAYEEREFFRIDHLHAAMGVLVHPNFKNEIVNGVAVTDDILYRIGNQDARKLYYVNTQVGEDLVTNPEGSSVPEEQLLSPRFPANDVYVQSSNRAVHDEPLLSSKHRAQLRLNLKTLHREFKALYDPAADEPFAIEIEFKVTEDNRLVIKQARPWVY